jgi:HAD superfamily hydrolase (TIGR01509 family)
VPALLLDLDGTMLDTDRLHHAVFAELMAPFGIVVDESHYRARIHGRRNVDYFVEVLPDHPDPHGLSDEKEAIFRRLLPRPYPATPGAAPMLDRARAKGWRLAVVTNAPPENAEAMLRAIGLRDRFEAVIDGASCPRGKPHPDPYLAALDRLGVAAEEALAFEDSPAGLAAARAAGLPTVGITSTLPAPDLLALGAAAAIADFTDPALAPLLDRLNGVPA